ncbi:MAG: DUF4157 domain-containing protein [Chloroflexi bacterium CFX7]|nr:DUF4157 domain-containing protein [Chloroflexi bacterium CFX7]
MACHYTHGRRATVPLVPRRHHPRPTSRTPGRAPPLQSDPGGHYHSVRPGVPVNLRQAEIDWLRARGLVDSEVVLSKVRLHAGGPFGVYLRLTNHSALTTGYHIWFRNMALRHSASLLVHELVHVGQYQRIGALRFLARYLAETIRRRGYSRAHSLEAPAYARQRLARAVIREHGGPAA